MKRYLAIVVMLLTFINTYGQDKYTEPHDQWYREMLHDPVLEECILNIGLFPKGFYWQDIHGHMWLFIPNPLQDIDINDGAGPALSLSIFLGHGCREEVEESVAQGKSQVVSRMEDIFPNILDSTYPNPPVILQTDRTAHQKCQSPVHP